MIGARLSGVVALGVAVSLLATQPAGATFPGRNGRLAFDVHVLFEPGMGEETEAVDLTRLRMIDPSSGRKLHFQASKSSGWNAWPSWAPAGRRLAFEQQSNSTDPDADTIAIAKPGGSSTEAVLSNAFRPAWGPSGAKLAFNRPQASQAAQDLFVADIGADGEPGVTLVARVAGNPDWSSRNTIAFTRGSFGRGGPDIYAIRPGGKARRLTDEGSWSDPSWAPNGRSLVAARLVPRKDRRDLYVVNTEHRRQRLVVRDAYAPAWSPDGGWIAFARGRSIFRVRPDGRGLRRLRTVSRRVTEDPEPFRHLSWQAR